MQATTGLHFHARLSASAPPPSGGALQQLGAAGEIALGVGDEGGAAAGGATAWGRVRVGAMGALFALTLLSHAAGIRFADDNLRPRVGLIVVCRPTLTLQTHAARSLYYLKQNSTRYDT